MIGIFRCNFEFCKYLCYYRAVSSNQFFSENIACKYFTFMYSPSHASITRIDCAAPNTLSAVKIQCQAKNDMAEKASTRHLK